MSGKKIQHTHDNELTHSMVHYLLTIHKLKEEKGYARVTDIAKEMALTKGSVSISVNNLKKRDLVIEDDNKFLSLSDLGHGEVHGILSSRTLLFYFLKDILGVSEEVAHKDSCLMEHLLSSETRGNLFTYMKDHVSKEKLSLDLSQFSSPDDFIENQKGDKYLDE
jgi:DtxR family Mn-dependent transcriptional regulator